MNIAIEANLRYSLDALSEMYCILYYWLLKSEPRRWSWSDQVKEGVGEWDGVRNYQAQGNMRKMTVGDQAFFYHSLSDKRIVGVLKIVREAYPDPIEPKFCLVAVEPIVPMPQPVTLASIKAAPDLKDIALVRQSRLSVMPIDTEAWKLLCHMGGLNTEDV